MTLEEALEKSGTANLVDDKTLQATKELIEPNEEILYALYTKVGMLDKFGIGTPGISKVTKIGIIVITNKNICFYYVINGKRGIKKIPLKSIKRMEQTAELSFKKEILTIFDSIYKWYIYLENNKQLENLEDAIYMAKDLHEQSRKTIETTADEIIKFKKLADEGIITEEEFQKKKEQLLNI